MDMLIKKFGQTNKAKKRLCLITNAVSLIKDPFEGTKEDQVNTIATQMTAQGMKMDCVIVRMKQDWETSRRIMEENDFLMSVFSNKSSSKVVYVESPTSLLGALRTRNISPVTIYRGDFEIGAQLKIKVRIKKFMLIYSILFNFDSLPFSSVNEIAFLRLFLFFFFGFALYIELCPSEVSI